MEDISHVLESLELQILDDALYGRMVLAESDHFLVRCEDHRIDPDPRDIAWYRFHPGIEPQVFLKSLPTGQMRDDARLSMPQAEQLAGLRGPLDQKVLMGSREDPNMCNDITEFCERMTELVHPLNRVLARMAGLGPDAILARLEPIRFPNGR